MDAAGQTADDVVSRVGGFSAAQHDLQRNGRSLRVFPCWTELAQHGEECSGDEVTGNYFDLLGVQPEAGRFFQAADEHGPNSAPYVVLSHALWRGAFNADPGVVGTTVRLDKDPFTVLAWPRRSSTVRSSLSGRTTGYRW